MDINRQSAGNESRLAWFIGFVDGEGSLMLQKRRAKHGSHLCPEIQVNNTHKETVDYISDLLKNLDIGHHVQIRYDKKNRKHKVQYSIRIAGMKRVNRFLNIFNEYFITKKVQADLLQKFITYRLSVPCNTPYGEKEYIIYDNIRIANRLGPPETSTQDTNIGEDTVRSCDESTS